MAGFKVISIFKFVLKSGDVRLSELLTWETLMQEGRSVGWWSAASSVRLVKLGGLESSTAPPEAQVWSPSLEGFLSNQDSHRF